MKKIFTLFTAFGIFTGAAFSQCVETPETKVLLIGDSWAAFMNADQTINTALKKWGHSNYKYTSNFIVSENGAETDDFLGQEKQDEIQNIIDENPSIEIVHVSIGGNDVMGDWNVDFSQGQTDTLEAEVKDRLIQIFDFIKSTRPGMRIFWGGYCYTNFEEIIEAIAPAQSAHPFYSTWEGMGFPENAVINGILNQFSDSVGVYAETEPSLDFVKATGVLQYTYGQEEPLGVAPYGTYPPFTVPLPEGDPEYPSPKESMRPYGFFTDCFHLSTEAYLDFVGYHMQKFYQKFFMDDLYLLSEGGTQDGTVSSDGNVSNDLYLGEDGGEQFSTVLTFNTTSMADTSLSGASIFIQRSSVEGTNPVSSSYPMQVKVVNGNFGTTVDVEAADFTAAADATDTACRFGSNSNDGDWLRLDLPASVLSHINNSATTQFILTSQGAMGGKMHFSDASDPDFAPVLNLKYGPEPPSSVPENLQAENKFHVYPNPATNFLTIANDGVQVLDMAVLDMMGKTVLKPNAVDNRVDVSSLPSGIYLLNVTTEEGWFSKRIIKR